MKTTQIFTAILLIFVSFGCGEDEEETKPFPLSGTYSGSASIGGETSDMTLTLEGSWRPKLDAAEDDSWAVSGTVTVFEWESSSISGFYTPEGSLGLEFDTQFIDNFFLGVEFATHSNGTISGDICKCTLTGIGQKIGSFTVTKQ